MDLVELAKSYNDSGIYKGERLNTFARRGAALGLAGTVGVGGAAAGQGLAGSAADAVAAPPATAASLNATPSGFDSQGRWVKNRPVREWSATSPMGDQSKAQADIVRSARSKYRQSLSVGGRRGAKMADDAIGAAASQRAARGVAGPPMTALRSPSNAMKILRLAARR